HFLWVVPGATPDHAKIFFSDSLQPGETNLLSRIAQTKVFAQDAAGTLTPLTWTKAEDAYVVELPPGTVAVHGSCLYGVLKRGDTKPFLLQYNMTLDLGGAKPAAWDNVPFQVRRMPAGGFMATFNGTPATAAEVVV